MRVTPRSVTRVCAICERTLLMGEHAYRFAPDGAEYVDVCPLCQEIALEHGWVREGSRSRHRARGAAAPAAARSAIARLGAPRRAAEAPVAAEPILRRLSEPELAIVEAADLFNASAFRRTIARRRESLGEPQVSIMPLSGVNGEIAITVAWEISWYQYRVSPDAAQPVRLAERGHDVGDARAAVPRVERAG